MAPLLLPSPERGSVHEAVLAWLESNNNNIGAAAMGVEARQRERPLHFLVCHARVVGGAEVSRTI